MARPREHDGVVYKRNDSNVWWMRYRDRSGTRCLESTNTNDWDEAQRILRERLAAPPTTIASISYAKASRSFSTSGRITSSSITQNRRFERKRRTSRIKQLCEHYDRLSER